MDHWIIHVESRYDISFFLTVSRLNEHRIFALVIKVIRKVFMRILNVLLNSITNRKKIFIEDNSNTIRISNWILSLWNCSRHRRCNVFKCCDRFDTFPDDFGIIPIWLKVFLIIIFFTFFQKGWWYSGVTLIFDHLPSRASEIEHSAIFSRSRENKLAQRFFVKFNLLLFFVIS